MDWFPAIRLRFVLITVVFILLLTHPQTLQGANTTYYVSSSTGSDTYNGQSSGTPFKTIAKVNSLALQPGDKVLFRCGDTWRAEMLRTKASGTATARITYSSYPTVDCANKPIISGSQPIPGWTTYAGNIYVADVPVGTFPSGINQLFRSGQRLGIGRWPNLDQLDGGYSAIDAQPSATQISDGQLPPVNWTGAKVHIRAMSWWIVNRDVTGSGSGVLTLNANPECWGGDCGGWGYWLSNHLNTLDRDGEWYYNSANRRVYVYSTGGNPGSTMEGSVVIAGSGFMGGVILGDSFVSPKHIVLENLEIKNWFDNGITMPEAIIAEEPEDIIIRNNAVRDVNKVGINLMAWYQSGQLGWFRSGRNVQITGNTVDGANRFGMDLTVRQSSIERNIIRNVALIPNLGASGMGCSITDTGGGCSTDGTGIRLYAHGDGAYSSNSLTIRYNRFENIAYLGLDVWGYDNLLENNFILNACAAKADCGAIYTWGGGSMATTPMRNLTIRNNIIVNTVGPDAGEKTGYRRLFGFGIYVDHNSKDIVTTGNTIIGSTASGILYQDSSGTITNNTLYDNASGGQWMEQTSIIRAPVPIGAHTGNILLTHLPTSGNLRSDGPGSFAISNFNRFYHANRTDHIRGPYYMSLNDWHAGSGHDQNSTELISSALGNSEIVYNETLSPKSICLSQNYTDLDGNVVSSPLTLQPFTSRILLGTGGAAPPVMTITKSALGGVLSGMQYTYTLTVNNFTGSSAANLLVTDTIPSNVTYVSGGTRTGNTVSWSAASIPACSSMQFSFRAAPASGAQIILNSDYRATANGGLSATGPAAMTIVDPKQLFLPSISR